MKKLIISLVIFICIAIIAALLFVRYISENPGELVQWGLKNQNFVLNRIDLASKEKATAKTLAKIIEHALRQDGATRHYLVLLQNHMELRPGGGFLGQVATVSTKDGEVIDWVVRDANHLDREIKSDILAPEPIGKWLGVKKLNFRDANWELDFDKNVENITHLYDLSERPVEFDGVIAFNASLLDEVLELTGPVTVPGHEEWGAFEAEGGILKLQDTVEKPFLLYEQRQECEKEERLTGIEKVCNTDPKTGEKIKKVTHADRENRKQILTDFAIVLRDTLMQPAQEGSIGDRKDYVTSLIGDLVHLMHDSLQTREMQMWMRDNNLDSTMRENNWLFQMDKKWEGDYIAIADANLGALKSDYYIDRTLEYTVDFTGSGLEINDAAAGRMIRYLTPEIRAQAFAKGYKSERPLATMRMTYNHTATEENYRTSDYHAYTRLYTPSGSEWLVREWFFEPDILKDAENQKTVFGYKYDIFIGDQLPTMLQYLLPEKINEEKYSLKIQKQSGTEELPLLMTVINMEGEKIQKEFTIKRDAVISFDATDQELEINDL